MYSILLLFLHFPGLLSVIAAMFHMGILYVFAFVGQRHGRYVARHLLVFGLRWLMRVVVFGFRVAIDSSDIVC